jgi:hypothetical protein
MITSNECFMKNNEISHSAEFFAGSEFDSIRDDSCFFGYMYWEGSRSVSGKFPFVKNPTAKRPCFLPNLSEQTLSSRSEGSHVSIIQLLNCNR